MQRLVCLIALFLAAAAFTGCGSSDGTATKPAASISGGPVAPADANAAPGTQATEPAIDLKNITPQDLITRYLTAVKAGDEQTVSSLLTETARRRTSEANIAVAPPGSDTAEFSVGDMQVLPNDPKTAHVASMWTDKDDQGKEQTLRIVWVTRHEAEGWRVAGMVTRLSKDQPLLVLDFENPEEVIRRQATAQEELTKRKGAVTPPTSTQVTAPAGSPQASNTPPSAAPPQNDGRYAAPPAVGNPMTGNPADPAIPNPVRQARNPSDDPAFLPR